MKILKITGACLLGFFISACSNSSNNGGDPSDPVIVGNTAADGEPVQIFDPGALRQNISTLFGSPDNANGPVDVKDDDTYKTLVTRLKAGI